MAVPPLSGRRGTPVRVYVEQQEPAFATAGAYLTYIIARAQGPRKRAVGNTAVLPGRDPARASTTRGSPPGTCPHRPYSLICFHLPRLKIQPIVSACSTVAAASPVHAPVGPMPTDTVSR